MEALRYVLSFLVMVNTAQLCWCLCQTHPTLNGRDECERKYDIERHELIGKIRTQAAADAVCRDYPQYEQCLTELIKDCPEDKSFLDMQGYDQESTVIAFKGFCANREVYLKGVSCYNESYSAIQNCFNNHSQGRDAALREVNTTNDWETFYQSFCPIQVIGAECVVDAVARCPDDVRAVLKNLAYSLMHGQCKAEKYGTVTSEFDRLYGGVSSPGLAPLGLVSLCVLAIGSRLI